MCTKIAHTTTREHLSFGSVAAKREPAPSKEARGSELRPCTMQVMSWGRLCTVAKPTALHTLVLFLLVSTLLSTAQAQQNSPTDRSWQPRATYTYEIETKWWQGTDGAEVTEADLDSWSPPVARENHGMRCQLRVLPLHREVWPSRNQAPVPTATRDGDAISRSTSAAMPIGANAWVFRAQLQRCSALRSRRHGPYVSLGSSSAQPVSDALLTTPFYFTLGDDGLLKRVHFFTNETLASRNLKRGQVTFFSFLRVQHDPPSNNVDQDEQGVYVGQVERILLCVFTHNVWRSVCQLFRIVLETARG